MDELNITEMDINNKLIDPVCIINKFASLSTFKDDIIFVNSNPIITAGIIKNIGKKTYNFEKMQKVGYISYKKEEISILSSNLIVKLEKFIEEIVFIIPYASYAMNILRNLNPRLGEKIVLIGLNIFSVLLYKLIKLSGTTVKIIQFDDVGKNLIIDEDTANDIVNYDINCLNQGEIDSIILLRSVNQKVIEFIDTYSENLVKKELYSIKDSLNVDIGNNQKLKIKFIQKFDKGYGDPNYQMGIKYPYPHVRWDFKRNLEYFISLVENDKVNINYFKLMKINLDSIEEINKEIENLRVDQLVLFNINS